MNYYPQHRREPEQAVPSRPPSECPSCHSPDITTTSKSVSAESYWRCVTCGDVWNAGRRAEARRSYR